MLVTSFCFYIVLFLCRVRSLLPQFTFTFASVYVIIYFSSVTVSMSNLVHLSRLFPPPLSLSCCRVRSSSKACTASGRLSRNSLE